MAALGASLRRAAACGPSSGGRLPGSGVPVSARRGPAPGGRIRIFLLRPSRVRGPEPQPAGEPVARIRRGWLFLHRRPPERVFVEARGVPLVVVVLRLSRADAADLLVDDNRPDVPALRRQAQALRKRLDAPLSD